MSGAQTFQKFDKTARTQCLDHFKIKTLIWYSLSELTKNNQRQKTQHFISGAWFPMCECIQSLVGDGESTEEELERGGVGRDVH